MSQQVTSKRLVSTHWPEGDDISRHEAIGDQPERAPALPMLGRPAHRKVLLISVFLAGAISLVSGLRVSGSAKPIACDATAGSALDAVTASWIIVRRG